MKSYNEILSARAQGLQPSGIRKFFDILDEMEDVVSLTVGQPDFITPWHIREAAIDSLENGRTYYTSNSGLMTLRQEISKYLNRRFGLSYNPKDEILVTVGGSEAIDLAIRACVNDGDEVIIPVPSFVCYGPMVTMAGGTPVYLETVEKDNFKLTPERLRSVITPRTKMLILPYPNNPTGAIMTESELKSVAVYCAIPILLFCQTKYMRSLHTADAMFQLLQLKVCASELLLPAVFQKRML